MQIGIFVIHVQYGNFSKSEKFPWKFYRIENFPIV